LHRVRLGPKFLVSYRPIIARASARVCISLFFIFFSLLNREGRFTKVKSDFTLVKWVTRVSRKNSGTGSVHEPEQ
ncbi:MAG: hypothetical protein WCE49_17380, partial [Terrimicrobiaceae bacterium]